MPASADRNLLFPRLVRSIHGKPLARMPRDRLCESPSETSNPVSDHKQITSKVVELSAVADG